MNHGVRSLTACQVGATHASAMIGHHTAMMIHHHRALLGLTWIVIFLVRSIMTSHRSWENR
jgi:hypothetical protein